MSCHHCLKCAFWKWFLDWRRLCCSNVAAHWDQTWQQRSLCHNIFSSINTSMTEEPHSAESSQDGHMKRLRGKSRADRQTGRNSVTNSSTWTRTSPKPSHSFLKVKSLQCCIIIILPKCCKDGRCALLLQESLVNVLLLWVVRAAMIISLHSCFGPDATVRGSSLYSSDIVVSWGWERVGLQLFALVQRRCVLGGALHRQSRDVAQRGQQLQSLGASRSSLHGRSCAGW